MDISGLTQLLNSDHRSLSASQQNDMGLIYSKLKQIAKSQKFKIRTDGLNTTALVNEAWLKTKDNNKTFNDRNHFFAYCSIAMRHILINQARKNKQLIFSDDDSLLNQQVIVQQSDYLLDLERQLNRLKAFSPRLEQVFTYKYFGDMDFASIAELLGKTERTIFRDWKKARTILSVAMQQ